MLCGEKPSIKQKVDLFFKSLDFCFPSTSGLDVWCCLLLGSDCKVRFLQQQWRSERSLVFVVGGCWVLCIYKGQKLVGTLLYNIKSLVLHSSQWNLMSLWKPPITSFPSATEVIQWRSLHFCSSLLPFRARKIPIIIRRYLPDGSYEDWGVDELIITDWSDSSHCFWFCISRNVSNFG